MSEEYASIDDYETLIELRAKLMKYKDIGSSKTLYILKRIKAARLSREFLLKTKVSRTIARLANKKFEDPSKDEANILKYSQHLINIWRQRIFNKDKIEYEPIKYKGNQIGDHDKEQAASKSNMEEEKEEKKVEIPKFDSEVRNKAIKGIEKYLQSGKVSQNKMNQLYIDIENTIYEKTLKKGDDQVSNYKQKVKTLCTKLIDEDQGKEFQKKLIKRIEPLDDLI
ncbi:Transcription factor IIS, N-terminal [Pseudocohnilembus persalinus]|uniref:Transcription factor IIS, N-terminal n=1 Tax=Pseudocohnilembus persalinus TaxID=266149 RepID=A0A0V0QHY0_PSEPJ|nr:Transcription factor IIS, N-terminal [Pseudocohnilembus persalinus]|eukprot:KRX01865.1 Transcription factor IIS, N-terminal [Pseudocohnilembus persalinus]